MNCPLCASGQTAFECSAVDRRNGLLGRWQYFRCRDCGVVFIAPLPTDEELNLYYSKEEAINWTEGLGSRFRGLRKLYHILTGDVDPRDFVEMAPNDRVLDYGCGHGAYLADFHARGIHIVGAETSSNVVQACRARGLRVYKVDSFDAIPFRDRSFDVVYLMQVFEHLRDPHGFLRELNRVLRPGGTLYLAVPNKNSIWRRIFKGNWVSGWYAPLHLFHYDRDSLARLARGHGFQPTAYWTRTPELWFRLNIKSLIYSKDNRLNRRRSWLDLPISRLVLMSTLRIVELPVRERDCLVMKLRKHE